MISSRIRLARNIKGIPFTGRMTVEQKKAVCTKVKEVAYTYRIPLPQLLYGYQ